MRKRNPELVQEALKDQFKWSPKAKRFNSEKGYVVKVKARLLHECDRCGATIDTNEEYYQLHYYGSWTKYPICEFCWSGDRMSSHNEANYKPSKEFATDGRRDSYWDW